MEAKPESVPSYSMGNLTYEVPVTLFVENRRRLLAALKRLAPEAAESSIIFLEGGVPVNHYNTDTEYPFRQEPFFHWIFGVTEPNFYGAIDVDTEKSYLFYPKPTESDVIWLGKLPKKRDFAKKYMVDYVYYTHEMATTLTSLNRDRLHVLSGKNTDSDLMFSTPDTCNIYDFTQTVDHSKLYPILVELRVIKTPLEVDVIRYACEISSEAHKYVMKSLKPGMYEYQAEAAFMYYVYKIGGCRATAYTCICASGNNGSVLHYGHAAAPNDKRINDGDLCLFDMGASYYGYASDITVTFPINGKFTDKQRMVYSIVFQARDVVFKNLAPGISWISLHEHAIREMLRYMKYELNLLNLEIDDMIEAGLGAVFQPHGLGHLLGIDVHDVGGYTNNTPKRPTKRGFNTLRTVRKLEPGMVVTVEPGCYFIDEVLDDAFNDPQLKPFLTEEINTFRGIGGVRIEDVVLVTETGYEILSHLPRTIDEIECFMATGKLEERGKDILKNGI
ncbi:xaa-Pro dipeptidase isoform X1 [Halyomorpha halys]|uniref:xaa-Pro dipeptidase isoform X1 n=3 Tax=Halyomorpha halys TaxID=286706 RepID=UPI0006D4E9D5|nr:xaa-Pro dipeptidase isoform X1 [Halyomorpha halys]